MSFIQIKKILILTILFQFFSSLCTEGCLKCDGNNNCLLCDASSLYVLVNSTCFKQDLEFCLLSFQINTCAMCISDYYLEVNNKCVTNPQKLNQIKNCAEYESFHRCKRCEKFYYLSDSNRKCSKTKVKIDKCQIYSSESTCSSCDYGILDIKGTSCQELEFDINHCLFIYETSNCIKCKTGYLFNENYYIQNIHLVYPIFIKATFHHQKYFRSSLDLPRCQKIIPIQKCKIFNEVDQNCTICEQGYFLSLDKMSCSQNPAVDQKFKAVKIPYCFQESTKTEVVNGISQTKSFCIICYENYVLSANGTKCSPHTKNILNCAVLSQTVPNECLKCAEGYYRDNIKGSNEKCHLRGQNNNCKELNLLSNECKTCIQSTYIKYYNNRYCSPPIIRCDTYNLDDQELTCKYCQKGYYFEVNQKKCLQNTGTNFDPYCSLYNSNKKCEQCLIGFFLNKVTEKCQSNSLQYIFNSQCGEYVKDQMDTCIDCNNGQTMMDIQRTCKIYSSNIFNSYTTEKKNSYVYFCESFEMSDENNIKCIYPLNPTTAQRTANQCQKDAYVQTTQCNRYYVDSNENTTKLMPYSTYGDQLLLCEQFLSQTNLQINPCQKCYDTLELVLTAFVVTNMCSSNDDMLFCLDSQRVGSSKFCALPFDVCGEIQFRYYENGILKYYPTSTTKANSCSLTGCQTPAKYIKNGIEYDYCLKYSQVSTDCPGGTYYRIPILEVITTPENICVANKYYKLQEGTKDDRNCLKIKDDICILCKEFYFPNQYQIFPYIKEQVDPYSAHEADSEKMFQCIVYNKATDECERCVTGYRLNPTTKKCISCSGEGKVGGSTNLECYIYGFGNVAELGICDFTKESLQADGNFKFKCLHCASGYVMNYKVSSTEIYNHIILWQNEFKESTFVSGIVGNWETLYCKKIDSNIFYFNLENADKGKYCEWGYGTNSKFYCIQCIFGYNGDHGMTDDGFHYIEGCSEDSKCLSTNFYFIEEPYLRNTVSCHVCVESANIPTIFFYFEKFEENPANLFWIYDIPISGVSKSTLCYQRTNVPTNCLVQVAIFSSHGKYAQIKAKIGYTSVPGTTRFFVCVLCRPKYKANFLSMDFDGFFYYPYKATNSCTLISYCASSRYPNICEQCDPFYILSDDKMTCTLVTTGVTGTTTEIESFKITFSYCNKKKIVNNVHTCTECKDGYVLTEKCVPYNVDGCKYYVNDKCVESKAKMGTSYSILYKQISSEYKVKQPKCEALLTNEKIPFCRFYNSNKKCIVCQNGYLLKSDKTECGKQPMDNCVEQSFTGANIECIKCATGPTINYKLEKQTVQKYNDVTYIQTTVCVSDSQTYDLRDCAVQFQGKCLKCNKAGYEPILINGGQNSLCVDINISNLCEEYDLDVLAKYNVISCKKCKKITDIQTYSTAGTLKLSQYDFFSTSSFESSILPNGSINYTSLTSQSGMSHLRAALFPIVSQKWCRNYAMTSNCLVHDDSSIDKSFQCTKCTNNYYLSGKICVPRSTQNNSNCVQFYIDRDECEISFDDSSYALNYSTFDIYVIETTPPKYTSKIIQIKEIENCDIYKSQIECQKCKDGYFLYDNLCLSSSKKISDCKSYDKNGICDQCNDGFFLFENKCLIIYATNCAQYLTNTKCLYCPTEFPQLKLDGKCYKNSDSDYCKIYESLDSCFECMDNFLNSKGKCLVVFNSYIENCILQIEGNICSQCKEGYSLNEDQKSCKLNPIFDRFCQNFTVSKTCSFCDFGYYLKDGVCYSCETNEHSCLFCNPESPDQCEACRPGFFMNNELVCIIIPNFTNNKVKVNNENLKNIQDLLGDDEVLLRYG